MTRGRLAAPCRPPAGPTTRGRWQSSLLAMSTWTEQLTSNAAPAAVLHVLTDPGAAARWAPVDFEVGELDGDRLRAGSRAHVTGRLAGREIAFDVEILHADEERLALLASG